ncbi:MAG: ParA family protein [Clostridia bacterium]|nr:ParA family protein [Clostridia bacterium]
MARVIAVANQKGGVGKTTTTVNLSAVLAQKGQKVLLVDMDPQGNATSGTGITLEDLSLYDALTGDARIEDCIQKSQWGELYVAGSDADLAGAEAELMGRENREYCLKNVLAAVRDSYDVILIDCPPSLGLLTLNALTAADSVLIPIQCEYYALEGVSALMDTLSRIRRSLNTQLVVEGILLTMLDGRTNLGLQVADQVKKHFKTLVYKSTIPRNVRLSEAPSHGEPIHIYDPKSAGALAYLQLGDEVLSRLDIRPVERIVVTAEDTKSGREDKGKKNKKTKKNKKKNAKSND